MSPKSCFGKKSSVREERILEQRALALVGNESALLHRVSKVKIVVLGKFKFKADCLGVILAEQTRLKKQLTEDTHS